MTLRRIALLCLALGAYLLFLVGAKEVSSSRIRADELPGSVVMPPTLQAVLYFGDRYLAANVESARVLATGEDASGMLTDYYHRLHQVVSALNPCHEDNYYIANAILAWAGGVDPAIAILREATRCRYWDEVPPFFLGYDLYFFKRDYAQAKAMLFEAANRATENRIGFQKMGIMFEAEAYPDVNAARNYLVLQRSQARDAKLRELLGLRIGRLDGLITLRNAQTEFEQRMGRKLENPQDLLTAGVLREFPVDPMRLGYEFGKGQFSLKELVVQGMEQRPK